RVPEHEQGIPIQDLYSTALQNRPEVEASEIGLENSRISIKGTKDALLPQLDLVADLRNNALAGQMNSLPIPPPPGSPPGTPFTTRSPSSVDPFFLGGWGRALTQLFSRNFPDYIVQVQLNIPLRNRSAQSDAIRDELLLRQQEITDRKTRKQVKVDVQNASIALRQAFAAYQTAVKSRQLTDQTLQAERKRFTMGATTFLNVIQVLLEQSTGEILGNHRVILDEAKQGLVSRPPGAIPVLDDPNGRGNRR